jgi:hypothetical protein
LRRSKPLCHGFPLNFRFELRKQRERAFLSRLRVQPTDFFGLFGLAALFSTYGAESDRPLANAAFFNPSQE